jgi:undecaprenyl-phosphate 4-deoxy-4-formamido-L-arabinose transferase
LVSFLIPCYNSEKTISGVVSEIKKTLDKRPEYSYEIILVNDSSPDDVFRVIQVLAQEDKAIDLAKNFG